MRQNIVARRCSDLWDRVDVLINCQAALDYWPADEDTIANWEAIVATNLLGPIAYTEGVATFS